MDISKIKAALALGFSGALTVSNVSAGTLDLTNESAHEIVALSSPDLKVTVYDGIATIFGVTESDAEAKLVEDQIAQLEGIEYVINMIASEETIEQ